MLVSPFQLLDYTLIVIYNIYFDLMSVEMLPAGLGVREVQRYLDDPMSDPFVRRDEETRSTTVEHVKLRRNRLEATTKEHIAEFKSYLVRMTDNLSRQIEYAAAATGRGNCRCNRDDAGPNEIDSIFNAKFIEFDRHLIALTAELGGRIEARLDVIDKKLGVVLGKSAEQDGM